jgi:cytoskeletal protein CcmA (bactofilin family)
MSIFRRDEEPRPQGTSHAAVPASGGDRRGAAAPASNTHIATGAKITVQVNGTSDLLIDGELEGQVQLDSHVTVGPEGRVRGDIRARTVRIGGLVQGNVQGLEKVEILPTGRLEGDVSAPRVVLAEGSFFKGKVEMTGQAKPGPGPGAGAKGAPAAAPEVPAAPRKAEEGA